MFGEFNGFMHGGVVGNPVEPENLVETQPQQVLEAGLLFTAMGLPADEPVERDLPADDAIDEFLTQRAINGRKPGRSQRALQ